MAYKVADISRNWSVKARSAPPVARTVVQDKIRIALPPSQHVPAGRLPLFRR